MEDFMTPAEAAGILRISASRVRSRVLAGHYPGAVRDKVSGRYRIPRRAVLASLELVEPPEKAERNDAGADREYLRSLGIA